MPRNSRLRASFFTAVIIVVIAASIPLLTQAQTSTPPAFLGVRTVVNSQGTQIVEVIPNSPAANGGLQVGDVIVAIENAPITGDYPIDAALAKLKPGDKAQFTLARNGQVLNMIVTLGSLPTLIPTSNLAAPTLGGATEGASPVPPTTYMGVGLEERTNGLLVVGVLQGGPADQAGIRLGDLFVVIEGQQLSTVSQAEALIQAHKPGDVVAVKAKRGDQTLDFSIRVAQRPVNIVGTPINVLTPGAETPSAGAPATAAPTAQSEGGDIPNGPRVKLGVTYEVVTPALVSEKNLSVDHGALVTTVTPGSPADVAGIKVGDVISEVDGDKVDAKRTLAIRMIPYIEGDTVVLTVVRGKQTLSISVTLVTRGSA